MLLEPAVDKVVTTLEEGSALEEGSTLVDRNNVEVCLLDIACGKGGDLPKWKSIAEKMKDKRHTLG